MKVHPLVKKTEIELKRLDKSPINTWEDQQKYDSEFLPISVEPKLRKRALKFMDSFVKLIEQNGHSIKFEYSRCHVEMYGVSNEINLRQKYFRKRIKDSSGYASNTFEKSNFLEFQVGYSYRKNWTERENKRLEDYINIIYDYIEKHSKEMAKCWESSRIRREEEEIQLKIEEEKAELVAIENEKFNQLIADAQNYNTANLIRAYLEKYKSKFSNDLNEERLGYLEWAYMKVGELDPLG